MEFALALRELSRRRLLLTAGVIAAALAAVFSVYRLEGGTLKPRSLQYSSATTQLIVDSPKSVLGSLSQSFEPLTARAVVYANFMTSPAVLEVIGKQAAIPGDQIYAAGPVNAQEPRVEQEPTALKRNVEITGETKPYRLTFTSQSNLPTIGVYAQAPTTNQALALANGAVVGLQRYIAQLQRATRTPPEASVTVRQLGPATGSVVDGGISRALAAIVFVAVLLLWCVLVLVAGRFQAAWRASASLASEPGDADSYAAQRDMGSQERIGVPAATHMDAIPDQAHTSAEPMNGPVAEQLASDSPAGWVASDRPLAQTAAGNGHVTQQVPSSGLSGRVPLNGPAARVSSSTPPAELAASNAPGAEQVASNGSSGSVSTNGTTADAGYGRSDEVKNDGPSAQVSRSGAPWDVVRRRRVKP